MNNLSRLAAPLLSFAFIAAFAACGGSAECGDDDCASANNHTSSSSSTGGAGGQGGQGGQGQCAIDPPGSTLTFRVHNASTSTRWLARGCGGTIPIEVETSDGLVGIGPGSGDGCEVSCDSVYAGHPNNGCSDCGPGVYDELGPGATVDIAWDRRVYVSSMAPEACSGSPDGNYCALGLAVDASAMQNGKLTACTENGFTGGCGTETQMLVSFTVDTTKSEATLELK